MTDHGLTIVRFWAALRRSGLLALELYTIAVMGVLLVRLFSGDALWWAAAAGNFIHWLLLSAALLLPVLLIKRRRLAAGASLVNLAAFAVLFGALFLPNGPTPEGRTLRVMSHNVGMSSATRLDDLLRETHPDIVALQELTASDAAYLREAITDLYPYQVAYEDENRGVGVLSRYPITADELIWPEGHPFPHLRAEIDIGGQVITVFSVHPPPPVDPGVNGYRVRGQAGMRELLASADPEAAQIWMGDFNTTETSDRYATIRAAGLQDAFLARGWGFGLTFPRFGSADFLPPLIRIDYIFHTDTFAAAHVWVAEPSYSDHLPLIAELILVEDSQ